MAGLSYFFTLLAATLIVAPAHHVVATMHIVFDGVVVILDSIPKWKHASPLKLQLEAPSGAAPSAGFSSLPPLEAAPWLN